MRDAGVDAQSQALDRSRMRVDTILVHTAIAVTQDIIAMAKARRSTRDK
ncbi:hypothetical protein [Candidatus Erwinia haradaeae]